jgi:hypothetical protein
MPMWYTVARGRISAARSIMPRPARRIGTRPIETSMRWPIAGSSGDWYSTSAVGSIAVAS